MEMSSEDSSSYPDEYELELDLGLSLGGSGGARSKVRPQPAVAGKGSWDQYARILTAEDFPSMVSTNVSSSPSSSSSSSPVTKDGSCGIKRAAEPSSPPGRSATGRQVVGWPPIRSKRMNSLVNQSKLRATGESALAVDKCNGTNSLVDNTNYSSNRNDSAAKDRGLKTSFLVKVTMDGIPIGRKVDLNAHSSYETLAHTLEDMFKFDAAVGARRSKKLLDGSSDFVLTYEDKEGDWMLVGDVPWEMFLCSVRRLRIQSTAEAK